MADVKIKGVAGGEKTTPVGSDALELEQSDGTSLWATIANITKGLSAATTSAQGAMSSSD